MNFIRGRAYADYAKAVRISAEVLEDYRITQVPLQLDQIIEALSNEVALTTYSRLMESGGLSYAEVIQMMDRDLGACAYNPQSCQYPESVKLGFQITLGRQRCVAKASNFPKNITNSEKRL